MRRVLVTGASGLIGRHCLPILTQTGFEVHAVSRQANLESRDVQWHSIDLQNSDGVGDLIERIRPTHLLHLAWYTQPGSFWSSPENRDWLEVSLNLFRKFERTGGQRIVATGSCAEYDWSHGICDELSTPCRPASLYGTTKLATATYLEAIRGTGNINTAWARLFFLYGPDASARRMPGVVISALNRGEPADCSAGTQKRDFLFVPDAADAIVTLLASDLPGPVNICSGKAIAIRDLALQTAWLMGSPDLLRLGTVSNASDEPPLVVGNPGRLRDELNWKPRYTLEEGLRRTVEEMTRRSLTRSA